MPFNVTDQLVVSSAPPTGLTAGAPFGLTIIAEDGQGNPDNTFNGSVTLELADGNGNAAALGGTVTVTAVNGVATYSGLTIDKAASGYTLQAVSTQAPGVAIGTIDVNAAATQVVVPAFAATVFTNTLFDLQVSRDPYGNVDPNFNGAVTLFIPFTGTVTVSANRSGSRPSAGLPLALLAEMQSQPSARAWQKVLARSSMFIAVSSSYRLSPRARSQRGRHLAWSCKP